MTTEKRPIFQVAFILSSVFTYDYIFHFLYILLPQK